MQLVELKDLKRKETPLHYIREFNGVAVLESSGTLLEKAVVFTVERKAVGAPDVVARFTEEPNWPILPLLRSIKDRIIDLDRNGALP